MTRVKFAVAAVAMVSAQIALAAKTKLPYEWKSDLYNGGAFTKILVIAVPEDKKNRAFFEDTVARAIGKRETIAVASYTLLPGSGKLDENDILEVVANEGFDAVTVTHFLAEVESESYQHPYVFQDLYSRVWVEPGSQVTSPSVYLTTSLYNASDKMEVWSVYTETPARGSNKSIIKSIAPALARSLREHGLIR